MDEDDATDLLMASQNALPNASSAQARQFDGSPEQDAVVVEEEAGGGAIWKIVRAVFAGERRRSGTAA